MKVIQSELKCSLLGRNPKSGSNSINPQKCLIHQLKSPVPCCLIGGPWNLFHLSTKSAQKEPYKQFKFNASICCSSHLCQSISKKWISFLTIDFCVLLNQYYAENSELYLYSQRKISIDRDNGNVAVKRKKRSELKLTIWVFVQKIQQR